MSEELFLKEISICKELYKNDEWCNWWKCENCWVIPLLYKLYKGILLEDDYEILNLKQNLLNQN